MHLSKKSATNSVLVLSFDWGYHAVLMDSRVHLEMEGSVVDFEADFSTDLRNFPCLTLTSETTFPGDPSENAFSSFPYGLLEDF